MPRKNVSFKLVYLIYLLLLIAAVAAALLYVRSLLRRYEDCQPERYVRDTVAQLTADAAGGGFWEKYALPEPQPGPFEAGRDVKGEYLALYQGELSFAQMGGLHGEDELWYEVESGGVPLARIQLKAAGPAETKLAVLTLREWTVEQVQPLLEPRDYTLTLPVAFAVSANGVPLLSAASSVISGGGEVSHTLSGLYLEPDLVITDAAGEQAEYTLRDGQVMVEFYHYTLTLPANLQVTLNGRPYAGVGLGDGRVRYYDVALLTKPELVISDDYGNTVAYEGGDQLPLTYKTITASDRYTVQVSGVAAQADSLAPNPDYALLTDYVEGLPQIAAYTIAVLEEDAEIAVTDELGDPVPLEEGRTDHDLTGRVNSLEAVPEEISARLDVLDVAQSWSLFMSDDVPFSQAAKHLVSTSYLYEIARKYATGEDIKFVSRHSLVNPPFADSSVTNFVWITDHCFSVDIRFVKRMRMLDGIIIEDPMNDRFYFVWHDDTENGVNDPAWKLAAMKEIAHEE